jgi:hypothetical protein
MKKSRTTTESTESAETDEKAKVRIRIRNPLPFFSGLCALCVSVVNPQGGLA